jgi:GalNAc-alpha-(1->4)-GalNAc-alpha-(1->3)-diNAcBac-PP-undecaprenol alpha-1,4-N-acetyl-D-galactosaminyltransferase
MAAGCACISFDCIAGPSDLISNNQNGILIENYNHENYKKYLHLLVNNDKERDFLTKNALVSIKKFSENEILEKYFSFITK